MEARRKDGTGPVMGVRMNQMPGRTAARLTALAALLCLMTLAAATPPSAQPVVVQGGTPPAYTVRDVGFILTDASGTQFPALPKVSEVGRVVGGSVVASGQFHAVRTNA